MVSNCVLLFREGAIGMIVAKKKSLIKRLNTFMVWIRVSITLCTGALCVKLQIQQESKPLPPPKLEGKRDIMPGEEMIGERRKKNPERQKMSQKGKTENKDKRTDVDVKL